MLNFKGFATNIFAGPVDKYESLFTSVRESLPRANIRIAFRTYMSVVFLASMIVYIGSLATTITVLYLLKISLLLGILFAVFIPVIIAMFTFLMLVFYPVQKMSTRRKDIESNLPFVLTHMGAVAESGVPPYVIFRLISQFKEYGEIATEMGKVVRNIETYGIDPLSSVKDVADKSPSNEFKQVLLGFVTATESGGNIKIFLKSAGEKALLEWRMKRERFLEQLSAYAEFYTGILIAAPLFIISLFSVMSMIQPTIGPFGILDLMRLSIYFLVPLLNGVFIVFLKGVEVEM